MLDPKNIIIAFACIPLAIIYLVFIVIVFVVALLFFGNEASQYKFIA